MIVALGIEYDGSEFSGWQVQPDQPTVQAALERALEAFLGRPTPTICAGRTDAGVHATHQVVSFATEALRRPESWVRGLNANLPKSVAVRWMREVPEDFHARFSARSRTYEYWILNDPVRSPGGARPRSFRRARRRAPPSCARASPPGTPQPESS